jgi:hypothetical protein
MPVHLLLVVQALELVPARVLLVAPAQARVLIPVWVC